MTGQCPPITTSGEGLVEFLTTAGYNCPEWIDALERMGMQTKTELLLRTDSPNRLDRMQEELSQKCPEVPDTFAADLRKLAQKSRLAVGGFPEPSLESQSPILFTAPHSIYLKREGHVHHVPEWHTSDLARKFAREVKGAYLTWTQQEEKRIKELFDIAGEPDGTNSDPNFTHRSKLHASPWTRELRSIRERFGQRPCLHVDLHGCQNPMQSSGSHVVVGLRALDLAGRDGVQKLRNELQSVLNVVLKGFHVSLTPYKLLTGAWDPEDGRCTLTQQSLSDEGGAWSHAVQLELCAKLRKVLSESTALQALLAQGLLVAWVLACRSDPGTGWVTTRSQCMDIMQEWMNRCTHFYAFRDLSDITKPRRRRKAIKMKTKSSDESEEEPERLSANSEARGFLCAGPSTEAMERFTLKGDEVWAHVWEYLRAVAVARPVTPAAESDADAAPQADMPGAASEEEAQLSRKLASWRSQGDKQGEMTILLTLAELHLEENQKEKALADAGEVRMLARNLQDREREAEATRFEIKAHLLDDSSTHAEKVAQMEAERLRAEAAPSGAAEALLLLAESDVLMGKSCPREAQRLAEKAVVAAKEAGSKRVQAAAAEALASAVLSSGRADRALKPAKEALALYQELGDKRKRACMLRIMSSAHTRVAQAQEAMDTALEAHDLCCEVGDRRGEVASLNAVAAAHLIHGGGVMDALDTARRAMKLSKEIPDVRQQVAALNTIVNANLSFGRTQDALTAAQEMLNASRPLEDAALLSNAVEVIMGIYAQINVGSKALLKANAQLRYARSNGSPKLVAAALQGMATAQSLCKQPEEALKSAMQARELLKELKDKKGEALGCNIIASYYADLQKLNEAMTMCEESVALQRELGDVAGVAQAMQVMVDLSWQKGADAKALSAATEQRKVFQDAGYKDEEAGALLQISDLTRKVKGIDPALKALKEARHIYQDLDDKESEAKALLSMANLYIEDQRLKPAIKVAKEAESIFQCADCTRGEADALLVVAHVHLAEFQKAAESGVAATQQGIREAIAASEVSRKFYESLDDAEGLAASLQLLSHCHREAGDGKKAMQAAREALELHDAMENSQGVATAQLNVASAHVLLGECEAAINAASDAASLAAEIGDTSACEEAKQLLILLGAGDREAGRPEVGAALGKKSKPP